MVDSSAPQPSATEDRLTTLYFYCARFVPAQALRKKLEPLKSIRFETTETTDDLVSKSTAKGGIILFHIGPYDTYPDFVKFLNAINMDLASGRISLLVIAKSLPTPLKNLFSRYPAAFYFPTTVTLSSLEEKILDLLKRDTKESFGSEDTDPSIETKGLSSNQSNDVFVLKGASEKAGIVMTDRLLGKMNNATEEGLESKQKGKWAIGKDADSVQRGLGLSTKESESPQRERSTSQKRESSQSGNNVSRSAHEISKSPKSRSLSQGSTDKFTLVTSEEQKHVLLKDSVESHVPIVIASPHRPERLSGVFTEANGDYSKVYCQFKDRASTIGEFKNFAQNFPQLNFSGSLKQAHLFVTSKDIKWLKPDLLELSPSKVYVIQRRSGMRLTVFPNPAHIAFAQLPGSDAEHCLSIFDISRSGIALVANEKMQKEIMSLGKLVQLRFFFEKDFLVVPEIRLQHSTPFRAGSEVLFYRMGFQFMSLEETLLQNLDRYIELNTKEYIEKYMAKTNS